MAEDPSGATATAASAAGSDTPRAVSRLWSFSRAVANRLARVPSLQPRTWAASARLLPSRQQSRNGARYFSGNAAISASRHARNSFKEARVTGDSEDDLTPAARSAWDRRMA